MERVRVRVRVRGKLYVGIYMESDNAYMRGQCFYKAQNKANLG